MSERPILSQDEHHALDELSDALASVIDRGASPSILIEAVKDLLEAFGEDWSDEQ